MDTNAARRLLEAVARGETPVEDALEGLALEPYARLLDAVADLHRPLRGGLPEVIFGPGKSLEQLKAVSARLIEAGQPALVTRCAPDRGADLARAFPGGAYFERARLFVHGRDLALTPPWPDRGELLVVTAGASDTPVALEAYACARFFGLDAGLIPDVGVAGLHRVQPHLKALCRARLIICCAGMEGALPSVLSGMCGRPIIAVPTSVGYGASFGGVAALLAMLNSCAAGVAVVNIDNGFGAAAMAAKLLAPESPTGSGRPEDSA